MRETLNKAIADIPMPDRMRRLPISSEGYPVPWFVASPKGKPDFRVVNTGAPGRAIRANLCWICGQTLGRFRAFVIGPMCAVNRVSSEPPSHRDCAEYAVRACPFLTRPRMRRNEQDLPAERITPAGIALARNPGVALVWTTRTFKPFRTPDGGWLYQIGDPDSLQFFAEGRPATRDEIMASVESGLPLLQDMAQKEGQAAITALDVQVAAAMRLIDETVPRWR